MSEKQIAKTNMSKKQREILKTFEEVLPKMTESEAERLLAFGQGVLIMTKKNKKTEEINV